MMNPRIHLLKYISHISKNKDNKQSIETMIDYIESVPRIFVGDNYLWDKVKELKEDHQYLKLKHIQLQTNKFMDLNILISDKTNNLQLLMEWQRKFQQHSMNLKYRKF